MFSDIGCGWATLKLGDFKGSCSYLTDPFVDVANLLINKEGVVVFDEEGSVFELVMSSWSIYIVSHRDKDELHMLDITEKELAAEFLDDIRNNFEDIVNWDINDGYEDSEYLVERRKMFNNFISKIKEIYNIEKSPEDISYWVYEVDMSKEDYAESVKWYRKAAEQGNADAQAALGNCYRDGIGVAKDENEAVIWLNKAIAQGHAGARESLETIGANSGNNA